MGTDIVTGQLIKVWSGFIEIHITADVAYGVWQYYMCTGDRNFMDKYGYELMLDCAKFWFSRLEPGEDGKLHINDVVGPDEHKEHVDDNAFTNYLVWWTIDKAIEYSELLQKEKPELYTKLDEKLELSALREKWVEQVDLIFLTQPNEDGVMPQDSTYLTLEDIDLSKYKKQAHMGGIYKDYNQEQITKIQVSKQADVMVLFLLMEELFPHQVKLSSWDYYEPRCLHDSSLSLSTHAVLAPKESPESLFAMLTDHGLTTTLVQDFQAAFEYLNIHISTFLLLDLNLEGAIPFLEKGINTFYDLPPYILAVDYFPCSQSQADILRACLKNVNTPKRRFFCRHTAPIFLEIHPVFLRKILFVWRQNSSPLCIVPFFKQRLILAQTPVWRNRLTWEKSLRSSTR